MIIIKEKDVLRLIGHRAWRHPKWEEAEGEDQLQTRCKPWYLDNRIARDIERIQNRQWDGKWKEGREETSRERGSNEELIWITKKNKLEIDENARSRAKKIEIDEVNV